MNLWSDFCVVSTADGNPQMARHSPPGPRVDRAPELRQQSVRLRNYGTPTSSTGQKPSIDVASSQTQVSAGLPITSGGSSYQVAPVSHNPAQFGYSEFFNSGSFFNPDQTPSSDQQVGGAHQQFNTYYVPYGTSMDVAAEVPENVGRVSPPLRRLYITQSHGGYMHAAEQMSHLKYDPDDRQMSSYAFGTAEIPSWFESDGQSGGSTQGSQQTAGGSLTVVQNVPVSSPGNSQQTQHNYYRESQNPQGALQGSHYHVVPGQNMAGGPGLPGFLSGFWTRFQNPASGSHYTQQSQDDYGTAVQRVPIGSHSAQQAQADYQNAVQSSQNLLAQGFGQKV